MTDREAPDAPDAVPPSLEVQAATWLEEALGAGTVLRVQPAGVKDGPREASVEVAPARVADVLRLLRDDSRTRLGFLANLTAVDWPARNVIELVYHLTSYVTGHELTVRAQVPRQDPKLPSVVDLFPVADWLEREQYDLLGVVFEGHPELRRLLMPDDWQGFPLRKDYVEGKFYRGMPTSRPSPMDLLLHYDREHRSPAPAPPPAGEKGPGA